MALSLLLVRIHNRIFSSISLIEMLVSYAIACTADPGRIDAYERVLSVKTITFMAFLLLSIVVLCVALVSPFV